MPGEDGVRVVNLGTAELVCDRCGSTIRGSKEGPWPTYRVTWGPHRCQGRRVKGGELVVNAELAHPLGHWIGYPTP